MRAHLRLDNALFQAATEDKMMFSSDEIDDVKAKYICFMCVGEAYLSEEIRRDGKIEQCSYCSQTAESYTVEDLAERIETAFGDHFCRTSDQPDSWQQSLLADRESEYEWYREGYPVLEAIETAAEISSDAAADVQMILEDRHSDFESAKMGEETEFSSDSYYDDQGPSDQEWQDEWLIFKQSLKTEARFFNSIAVSHLASVFNDIDKLKTTDDHPLVLESGPQSTLDHLFRAREFQSEDKLKEAMCRPDIYLGSPPANLASAGRMNACGISVFYGATKEDVAIAEVRPPVGSRVAVARFNIIRPLRLLDLTALKNAQESGSIFDPSLKSRLERVAFLRSLEQMMARPIMPNDEAFDYLATQAIADFLATENTPKLDGIIFSSAQVKDGRNVVLFHKAARVEAMEIPDGTEIEAHTGYVNEDGWEVIYAIWESVPSQQAPMEKADDGFPDILLHLDSPYFKDDDSRESTLRIDPKSVVVHHVEWVKYHCTPHSVGRHRSIKMSHSEKF